MLRPSAVHGIGVHTTEPIRRGEHLRLWQPDDWRFISFADAEKDPDVWAVRDIYCVTDADGYRCPLDFHRMSIGWYMNHAEAPNVRHLEDGTYEYFAVREIAAGEEILCDYRALTPYEHAP